MTKFRTLHVQFLVDFLSKRIGEFTLNIHLIGFGKVIAQSCEKIEIGEET